LLIRFNFLIFKNFGVDFFAEKPGEISGLRGQFITTIEYESKLVRESEPLKTFSPKKEAIERKWYLVDANNQVLGRLASQVARILRGKHKPIFAPHIDVGDNVIIINAEKIRVTGKKAQQKRYKRYSGYPGGFKETVYNHLIAAHPERILEHAIKGMLPKNRLGRQMFKKLKIYAGSEHPHSAQNPEPLTFK